MTSVYGYDQDKIIYHIERVVSLRVVLLVAVGGQGVGAGTSRT